MMKILVVDDNLGITALIEKFFRIKKPDWEVKVAYDGAQALDLYGEFKPDVITLDMDMPVMSGMEFLTKLRENDKKTAVVMTTASGDASKECSDAGANGFIVKPFAPMKILEFIENLKL